MKVIPLLFPIKILIKFCKISTSGVPLELKPIRVLIPANSLHSVTLVAKAPETGNLVIRGCIVRAPGSIGCEFLLPLSSSNEEEEAFRRRSAAACEIGRFKRWGLESFPWSNTRQRLNLEAKAVTNKQRLRFLECVVVPEQPLLRVRRTSVTHGALMLYNGEM